MSELHIDAGNILSHEFTADGFLRVYGRVAKVGPLVYRDGDRTRVEQVTREVLFDKASADTLKMLPITLGHPDALVTPDNAREHQRGMTGHLVIPDGDFLGITMAITDRETIDAITSGAAQELSCGYLADTIARADGSLEQVNRTYNHVAVVARGRAGPEARLKLDSDEIWIQEVRADALELKPKPIRRQMRRFTIDSEIIEVEDEGVAKAITGLLSKLKGLDGERSKLADMGYGSIDEIATALSDAADIATTTKAKLDEAEGKIAGLELARTDAVPEKVDVEAIRRDAIAGAIGNEITVRLDAWEKVKARGLPEGFTIDHALDVPSIYRAYLLATHPEVKLDGRDDGYVLGLFEGLNARMDNKATELVTALDKDRASVKLPEFAPDKAHTMSAVRSRALPGLAK